jgi:hypothetical protein
MSGPAWFLRLRDTAPNWTERYAAIEAALTEGLLDSATLGEYLAEGTPTARAQAVLDALVDPVTVRVYDGDGTIMGQGTMRTPWATTAGGVITLGEVTQFVVTQSGTPDPASWYLRFESGTRWVRGSFGLVGSLAACTWSLPTWEAGQNGTIGTVTIGVPSGSAPSLVGAASALTFTEGVGGTYNFSGFASDPDGGAIAYSLVGTPYVGISINPTSGVLSVETTASAAVRNLIVRVTDAGGLSSDWPVTVTISSVSQVKWHPGHYARTNQQTTPSVYAARQTEYATTAGYSNIVGVAFEIKWGWLERTTQGSYDLTYLEREIAYIASLGKKAIINIGHLNFSGSVPAAPQGTAETLQRCTPDYVIQNGWAGNQNGYAGWGARLDIAGCMDRYIALIQHLGAAYNGDPRVAAVTIGETSSNLTGYNTSNGLAQWLRVPQLARAAWPTTPFFIANNYLNSRADTKTLTDRMVLHGIGMNGPDIYTYDSPDNESWGASCIRGRGGDFGTTDSRAVVGQMFEMQVIRGTSRTKSEINNLANNERKNNFTVWTIYNGFDPPEYGPPYAPCPEFRWESATGVRQYINNSANAVTNTTLPSAWAAPPPSAGIVMHNTTWETDPTSADVAPAGWSLSNTGGTGDTRSFQTTTPRTGTKSMRFTLTRNSSADWRNEYSSGVGDTVPFCTSAVVPQPIEQWVGYSMRLVSPYPTDTTHSEVIGQWHNGNTVQGTWAGGISRWDSSPVLALWTWTNGNLRLIGRWCDLIPANSSRPSMGSEYYGAGYEWRCTIGALSDYAGIWSDWVWRVVWDWRQRGAAQNPLIQYPSNWMDASNSGGTGLVQLWTKRAGESVYTQRLNYVGPVGSNDYQSAPLLQGAIPYYKFGIYKRGWEIGASNVTTRHIEYDNMKIIRNGGSFNDVAPGGNP